MKQEMEYENGLSSLRQIKFVGPSNVVKGRRNTGRKFSPAR